MRERDRLVIREHLVEVAAEQAAEKERIEAPIRAAEAELQKTHRELVKVQRENILKMRDDGIFVSPELREATMSQADAAAFNLREANKFVAECPFYAPYKTDENANILVAYFLRNGIKIFDAQMLRVAFVKLRDIGALEANAAPEAEPEPIPEPTPEQSGPKTYVGRDYTTGLEREFTEREVNRMSSLEYQRAFPIAPTFKELFSAMRTT